MHYPDNVHFEDRDKCLPFYDAPANTPSKIMFLSQMPRSCWLIVYMLICLFWNLERIYPCHVWCSLFWQNIKLCWKPCFSGTLSQSYWEAVSWAIVPGKTLSKTKLATFLWVFLPVNNGNNPNIHHSTIGKQDIIEQWK